MDKSKADKLKFWNKPRKKKKGPSYTPPKPSVVIDVVVTNALDAFKKAFQFGIKESNIHKQEVEEVLELIDKEIVEAANRGSYCISFHCIKQHARHLNCQDEFYKNRIIVDVKKHLIQLGYKVRIYQKTGNKVKHPFKSLLIKWSK